ncbi:MAG: hypothetical protein GY778_22850, partial [bacterium]|nr:hypothetical protein [bacterium]
LSGEGGRRVFTPDNLFDPTGANSTGARNNLEFGDVLVNFTDGRARAFIGKAQINHQFNPNFQVSGEYVYSSAFDNSPYDCCTAGGGYADPTTGAFGPNEIGDVGEQDHAWGRSDFSRKHTLVGSGFLRIPMSFGDIRLSAFWKSQSGRPWTVIGDDDLNGDGLTGNDRVFVFAPANIPLASAGTDTEADDRAAYADLLNQFSCVGDHQGEIIPRNTCTYPWRHQLDMRVTFGIDRIFG